MTERMMAAMDHPLVDAIGHPTGPQDPAPRALCDRRRASGRSTPPQTGTMLEINANPDRRDLKDMHARLAAEAGVMIVINSDAHSAAHAGRDPLRRRDRAARVADQGATSRTRAPGSSWRSCASAAAARRCPAPLTLRQAPQARRAHQLDRAETASSARRRSARRRAPRSRSPPAPACATRGRPGSRRRRPRPRAAGTATRGRPRPRRTAPASHSRLSSTATGPDLRQRVGGARVGEQPADRPRGLVAAAEPGPDQRRRRIHQATREDDRGRVVPRRRPRRSSRTPARSPRRPSASRSI